mmetsp:Transcript_1722/g.5546  ORF Transcript_1722/g.5546 Transcript_1722/m.5546 type:complete len:257 (+) Transcript_1722:198-968(+)
MPKARRCNQLASHRPEFRSTAASAAIARSLARHNGVPSALPAGRFVCASSSCTAQALPFAGQVALSSTRRRCCCSFRPPAGPPSVPFRPALMAPCRLPLHQRLTVPCLPSFRRCTCPSSPMRLHRPRLRERRHGRRPRTLIASPFTQTTKHHSRSIMTERTTSCAHPGPPLPDAPTSQLARQLQTPMLPKSMEPNVSHFMRKMRTGVTWNSKTQSVPHEQVGGQSGTGLVGQSGRSVGERLVLYRSTCSGSHARRL